MLETVHQTEPWAVALRESIDEALSKSIKPLQAYLKLSLDCIHAEGGQLRQFIADDKGLVLIWSFGLPQGSYENNATRGLRSAFSLHAAFRMLNLRREPGKTWRRRGAAARLLSPRGKLNGKISEKWKDAEGGE